MKKTLTLILVASVAAGSLTDCGGSGEDSSSAALDSGVETAAGTETDTAAAAGEKQMVEFWCRTPNEQSSAMFEEIFDELNASQGQYEFVCTGLANEDFLDTFVTAVATRTMPDVVNLGFPNAMTYVAMDALHPIQAEFETWEDSRKAIPPLISTLKDLAGGEDLYGVPYGYNQDLSWYNAGVSNEKGARVPQIQKKFLAGCEKYAGKDGGTYFFSLRGNKSYDNLLGWLFIYADGPGYENSYFGENRQCIIDTPEFAEAMDAYVDIYKSRQVSGGSANNGFNEMVAEFGAGIVLYIMHNPSSEKSRKANPGNRNHGIIKALANDKGRYSASTVQPNIFSVCDEDEGADYNGAVYLIKYLCSTDTINHMDEFMTGIPTNTDCYEIDWFKADHTMQTCMGIVQDENFIQIQSPYRPTLYFPFINGDVTTDFQTVMLGEMTPQDRLDK